MTSCLSSKYAAVQDQLATMEFGARKSFDQAIVNDCKQQQGRCAEIISSDPVCAEVQQEAAAEPGKKSEAGKKGEGGKKDDKAKEKKK